MNGVSVCREELPELSLELRKVDLDSLQSILDLFQADVFVGFVRSVKRELVAVLLNDLAAVSDFVETKSG